MRGALVLDTNVLILRLAASVCPELIGRHRRLRGFLPTDPALLDGAIAGATRMVTTAPVVTEASNLIGSGHQVIAPAMGDALRRFVTTAEEAEVSIAAIVERPEYLALGFTDTALVLLAERGATVVTTDYALAGALAKQGSNVVNFNTLRTAR